MLTGLRCGEPHRPTRDLDLLRRGAPAEILFETCAADAEDDGAEFAADSVRTELFRQGNSHLGSG
jgi:hypothetical protein